MANGPTVNLISGRLVACYTQQCDIFQDGEWRFLQNTSYYRTQPSSAAMDNSFLLIGGLVHGAPTNTTELIPIDGSPSCPGPIMVNHGQLHCTIQVSADVIVVSGGSGAGAEVFDRVTEYQLSPANQERPLTKMLGPRCWHACAVYQNAAGQKVQTS